MCTGRTALGGAERGAGDLTVVDVMFLKKEAGWFTPRLLVTTVFLLEGNYFGRAVSKSRV